MNVSKKIAVLAAICVTLGVGGTAYASQPNLKDVLPASKSVVDGTASAEGNTLTNERTATEVAVDTVDSHQNVPSEGDKVINDKFFVHTYSNGQSAIIPFDREMGRTFDDTEKSIDVDSFKKLGSNIPPRSELCYQVVEFLDGTKRYFKLGEAPLENVDMLKYGIYSYVESVTSAYEYYIEVLPNGMTVEGWR